MTRVELLEIELNKLRRELEEYRHSKNWTFAGIKVLEDMCVDRYLKLKELKGEIGGEK
jgi:hypothetical protein